MITKNKKLFTYIFSAIIAVAVCAGMQFFNVSAADNQDDIQTDANGLVYNLSYNTKSAEIIGYTGTSTEITVNQFVTFDYTETVIGSDGVPITNTFPVKYTVKSLGSGGFQQQHKHHKGCFQLRKNRYRVGRVQRMLGTDHGSASYKTCGNRRGNLCGLYKSLGYQDSRFRKDNRLKGI